VSCEAYGILISRWADGEATAEEARRVESHVAACPACRALAAEFRRNDGLVASAFGPETFGQRVATGVLGRLARREKLLRGGARLAAAAGILAAFLLGRGWASRPGPELAEFEAKLDAARLQVARLEALAEAAAARPPVEREVIRETRYVFLEPGQLPPPLPEDSAIPEAAHQSPVPPADDVPPRHPGTVAMDRLTARADGDTGVVSLSWSMTPPPGAVYFVFRRPEGDFGMGEPLHADALLSPRFEDPSAPGLSVCEYRVVAVGNGKIVICNDVARLTTPPDIRVEFKGLGKVEERTTAVIGIRTRQDGRWSDEATWYPQQGDRHEGTGFVFRDFAYESKSSRIHIEATENGRKVRKPFYWNRTEPRVTLETPAGTVALWSGETAAGSRRRLDVAERER